MAGQTICSEKVAGRRSVGMGVVGMIAAEEELGDASNSEPDDFPAQSDGETVTGKPGGIALQEDG